MRRIDATTTRYFLSRPFVRWGLLVSIGFSSVTSTTAAIAEGQEAAPGGQTHGDVARHWYGYQTGVADVAALGFFAGSLATFQFCPLRLSLFEDSGGAAGCHSDNTASDALLISGLAVYGIGAPAIHAAHGHWDKAGLSFGLRAAPLLVGGLASKSGVGSAILVGGVVAAMVIDDAVVANEDVAPRLPALSVVPGFDPTTRVAALVVAGAF
jgi:hypothetical protein